MVFVPIHSRVFLVMRWVMLEKVHQVTALQGQSSLEAKFSRAEG
jgi:hypothetical protein